MIKSRLEIYPSKDIKDTAFIVGEKSALRELAKALLRAADNPIGFDSVNIYKGNGHNYEIIVTKNVSENEWQNMPEEPSKLEFVDEYISMKNNLKKEIL